MANIMGLIDSYNSFEKRTYEEILKYSKTYRNYHNNFIVEIGSSNNSYYLNPPLRKFRGILVEGQINKINGLIQTGGYFPFKPVLKMVNADNVCDLLYENDTPDDFYMLNLDIDGADFFVLIAILKKFKPKFIVTEFNEMIPIPFKYAIKNDPNFKWGWNHNYGYSVECIKDIMTNFGYRIDNLIVNNIFLSRIDDKFEPNIENVEKFYNEGYLDHKEELNNNEQYWNKDIDHFHDCKTEKKMEEELRKYFLETINVNNGASMVTEVDKYLINDDYEKYLAKFLKE